MSASRSKAGSAGRSLPHSLEAEEYLLSCCLLDGADMVSRCVEARIRPESFYETKHGIVFERVIDLHRRQMPIDVAILAEEMKAAGQLERVGGYSFLTQVSSRLPTTAQAAYFIEKVREQALLREVIRKAVATVEDCHGFSGRIDDFVATIESDFAGLAEQAGGSLAQQLRARRMNPAVTPPDPRVIYSLGTVPICTAGNISCLNAEAKVGKSALAGAMLAAPMAQEGADCLTVQAENGKGHALLAFDTEQSAGDWFRNLCRAKRRAGIENFPPWFVSYHLTGMSAGECRAAVKLAMEWAQREFGGIFAVFIDGVADLVTDPNSPEECFPFVTELHALAIKHDTAIVNVLHKNPGSDKTRGHLGSQLERKAETNLTLEKDDEGNTVAYSLKQRGPSIPKGDGPRFRWSDGAGMHVSCETVRTQRDRAKTDELSQLAADIFGERNSMKWSELKTAIETTAKCSDRTADGKISEMRKLGILTRTPPNLYSLVR